MVTRAKDDIRQPNPKYALTSSTNVLSPTPSSVHAALRDANWKAAMQQEFNALQANRTWTLVPRPPGARVISCKWVFKTKLNPDSTLDKYKARWVLRGDTQRPGLDFGETFSPVVKPATIRTVLTLIAMKDWPAHQLDVSNAFLHGNLDERVFCRQLPGFENPDRPDHVCLLSKSLYGLRQAPRAWFTRFVGHVTTIGFVQSRSDASLFVLRRGRDMAYLLLYVDDMILSASSPALLRQIVGQLRSSFAVKDMGPLKYFLGIEVERTSQGFFLSQRKYTTDVL
jgi:histone deacetylase 1/2